MYIGRHAQRQRGEGSMAGHSNVWPPTKHRCSPEEKIPRTPKNGQKITNMIA